MASLLAGFLLWEKIPRPIAVDVWCYTILVYIVCFGISLEIFARLPIDLRKDFFLFAPLIPPAFS